MSERPRDSLDYALASTGPNPLSRATTIQFSQPRNGRLSIAVYDIAGHRVRTLVNESLRSGTSTRSWDGRDDAGRLLGSGVYFVRMKTAGLERSQRIVLAR